MIKGKNVKRFKITSDRIADCNQNFILQENIILIKMDKEQHDIIIYSSPDGKTSVSLMTRDGKV